MAEDAEQRRIQEIEANEKLRLQTEDLRNEEYNTESSVSYEDSASTAGNRKQPLFKASIGGIRPMVSQSQSATLGQDDAEDLDGQSTPAGPMPKSKGGPVPLMSLEIKAPPPQEEDIDQDSSPAMEENSSVLPKALEQALAFKTERAHEMGVRPEDIIQVRLSSIHH